MQIETLVPEVLEDENATQVAIMDSGIRYLIGPRWSLRRSIIEYHAELHKNGHPDAAHTVRGELDHEDRWKVTEADVYPENEEGVCRWPDCDQQFAGERVFL